MDFLSRDKSKDTWLVKLLALAALSGTAFFYMSGTSVTDVLSMVV